MQFSEALRNARAAAIETTVGASPILRIRTGAPPATLATADAGTVLVEIALPADWLTAPAGGAVGKAGTWSDAADAAGIAGHFRIYTSGGVATIQGTAGEATGVPSTEPDLTIDNSDINVGQTVTVTGFTVTEGNA